MAGKIRLVVATRETQEGFYQNTATGKSIALYAYPFVEVVLHPQNRLGLPIIYNQAIHAARNDPATLIFIHDDIHLCDYFWARQINRALLKFQIAGLAGNKRRVPRQPGWVFLDEKFTPDTPNNLSGVVGHGKGFPPTSINYYGEIGEEVKLLDGLLLAAHSQTLLDNKLFFDENFQFHFYDMDFCRQAELKNVKMGTIETSVIHESGGNFRSTSWASAYQKYLSKWGE